MLNLLDVLEQLGINTLLHALQLLLELLLLRLALLNLFKSDFGSVLELVLGESLGLLEEGVVDVGSNTIEGDTSRGGQNVGGIHTAKGHSIDTVGTSHQQVT